MVLKLEKDKTPASLVAASMMKKKAFITLMPGVNIIKYFLLNANVAAK